MSFMKRLVLQQNGVHEVVAEKPYTYSIPLTMESLKAILKMDEKLVGTADYMGMAYFWGQAYKHELREAKPVERKKIHDAWLAAKLDFLGESQKHEEIIKKYMKKKMRNK